MGDIPNEQRSSADNTHSTAPGVNAVQYPVPSLYHEAQGFTHDSGPNKPPQTGYPTPYSPPLSPQGRQDRINMNSLGHALSNVSYHSYGFPSYPVGLSPAQQYQMQIPQFAGQTAMNQQMQNMPYNVQYETQYAGMYNQGLQQGLPSAGPVEGVGSNQYYQGTPFMVQSQQPPSPCFVQSIQYRGHNQIYPISQVMGQHSARGSFVIDPTQSNPYLAASPARIGSGRSGSIASSSAQSSVVRGPPRKPRQSGHAIWIGNLPPHTDLMSLVAHVCKETLGLESLFLISKSNCAFANFKDEAACAAAQATIHDSRFQTVRLVSRLRKSSTGSAKPFPIGPAALNSHPVPAPNAPLADGISVDSNRDTTEVDGEISIAPQIDEAAPAPRDKYFVVKSLTVEDLELSVRNGIWATQSHNEDFLNQAYQSAESVYLIFSANKSGEYFGYAKMISPINDDPAAAIEFAPKAHNVEDPDLPKAIPTPATEFSPNGRIIDDSARGTIFWEAEREELADGDSDEVDENRSEEESGSDKKAWGKPFKIEWISTTRLPFYRTRGLRNPWNSNREVKIARDGTELETNVGQRLVGLFHRVPSPIAPLQSVIPMMGVYPPVGPFR